ncbi:glycolate oxidase subunit GlcE [Parachitinimonas caeni]|uniref:Glycolate oxidase subunit GlcE n=1 Tax=Parachitinimonas caeni TaxID=3031301 RepID=A0ABT7E249_9NEIS|nr:glycolate oxidase subunit GlcE [Parachitinimonas caeni]MDK2126129.1 glycolate oxidase subunit GlcE [Parachitinimonas caeni]
MLKTLQQQIADATASARPLQIRGGGSKAAWLRPLAGEPLASLDIGGWRGIVDYAPTELVITVKAGTPLAELYAVLAAERQMLACESPCLNAQATVGGTLATAWAGPRRPYAGGVRDQVLGISMINGNGELLRFGGRVMKNVAGFDVSRLMVGSHGSLGLIVEASLKVWPCPAAELTLQFEMHEADAILQLNRWAGLPLPLSASHWRSGVLHIRLSGAEAAIQAARRQLGGEVCQDGARLWQTLSEEIGPPASHLNANQDLWRLSLPPHTPPWPELPCMQVEWGGGLRWLGLRPDQSHRLITLASAANGHARLWQATDSGPRPGQPPSAASLALHRRIKSAFDPAGIFNPGILFEGV